MNKSLVRRRRLDHLGEAAECHDADPAIGRLAVDERTAAASAATSRFGAMSPEHMLPDTSIDRMIVVWLTGR